MTFKKGHIGYFKGQHFTEEHKKNLSISLKGRVFSEETRKKLSEIAKKRGAPEALRKNQQKGTKSGFKGKHHSKESKDKLSLARKGMQLTPEWREKISCSLVGNHNFDAYYSNPDNVEKISRTIIRQPINQTNIIKTVVYMGDNLIVSNGTSTLYYEDGNLTISYSKGNSNIFPQVTFSVGYKSVDLEFDYWIHMDFTSVPEEIRFEIPRKGKYVSASITDTFIIFQRVN